MIEVREMSTEENEDLLETSGYGHFAFADGIRPYVIPLHFAYCRPNVCFYTTDGKKTRILRENPNVCLQVEEVIDRENWRSVIVNGTADEVLDPAEREQVVNTILRVNPTLTPAVSVRWLDNWVRENVEAIYTVKVLSITGRASGNVVDRPTLVRRREKPS